MVRGVFPNIAKLVIGASANFKFRIRLPRYPIQVSQIIVSSTQNLDIAGSLFHKLKVTDILGGGEHIQEVDIDGTLTLGGVSDTFFEFTEDVLFEGKNLDASQAKVLLQFLVFVGEP